MNSLKIKGKIIITSFGSGYVSSEKVYEDVYIPFQMLNTALNGDEVEVALHPKVKGEKTMGEVVRIISRKKARFVGTVEKIKGNNFAFISTDDHKMYVSIFIPNISPKIKNGTKILVEIIEREDRKKSPTGKVLKVIGRKGDNNTEMESIVIEKGLNIEFPKKIKEESKHLENSYLQILKSEIDKKKRRDFRNVLTFSIDPGSAKDFDDAISFKEIAKNVFEVGIHIADVEFWIKEKSPIDGEARKRGFSIYLADRTIPMLPEVLSNNICSLNPNEDKLTFSVIFKITRNGEIKDTRFEKTIINSNKKFTYQEVQEIIEGKKKGPFLNELRELTALTKKLRKKRIDHGAFEFGSNEVCIDLDSNNQPTKIYLKEGIESQQLIEELMVLANRKVALFVNGKDNKGFCLFRIHGKPDKNSLEELFLFLKKLGYNIKLSGQTISSKEINSLLEKVKGRDEEFIVKSTVIRSLPKAVYSVVNKGHFAMALSHYAHFTSPIRRYADLLVHRALFKKIEAKPFNNKEKDFYNEAAKDLSEKEIEITSAERLSVTFKQVEYMMKRIGENRKGIISNITEWGIYIQDSETHAEGMIRFKNMKDDFYVFNKESFSITGLKRKKKYSLGDKVEVKVIGGDIERKILDYSFV